MPTPFCFEHVFTARSVANVLAAYFDPDHLAAQDRLAELRDRTVIEVRDEGVTLYTSWRVAHDKPLPIFARPFVRGGRLSYVEAMTWRRADHAVDLTVTPEVLGGRVVIEGTYQLSDAGPGRIHRRFGGTIGVDVRLVGAKIERGILAKFEDSMPMMTRCTQDWLDKIARQAGESR